MYLLTDWLIDWLGFNAVFNNFSVISQRPVHLLMFFPGFLTPVLYTTIIPSNWLLFHIALAHWWKTNDACRIDFCQMSVWKLVEPGFKLTTPGLTARVATDWPIEARHLLTEAFFHNINQVNIWVCRGTYKTCVVFYALKAHHHLLVYINILLCLSALENTWE